MKTLKTLLAMLLPAFLATAATSLFAETPQDPLIRIQTDHAEMTLLVGKDGRIYQLRLGRRPAEIAQIPEHVERHFELHPQWGNGCINEPALMATHADGNTSTDLLYVRHETKPAGDGAFLTQIELKDAAYPFFVTLFFKTYPAFDLMETWSEIRHAENGAVKLERFASTSPIFQSGELTLTQFLGNWADEMNPRTERLGYGVKVIDSKLGVRANQYRNSGFLLTPDGNPKEDAGETWAGSLEYPGNFQFAFEKLDGSHTRAICGINPFSSAYQLEANRVFVAPKMIWAYSSAGSGPLSRNFHRWARQYVLRDGGKPRAVLLNNWEATFFGFNEEKLVSLFDAAKALGFELFLLDDGWFGVKYPRDNDHVGLGDWKVNPKKLPHGLSYLCDQAKERGLRFGLWLEPEMVNPGSELFEQHPDWVVRQPHRDLQLERNQLVLDLSRPEVKAYVFKCIDDVLTENPGISYVKWDCNRRFTQPGSPWLAPDKQTHLAIDYNAALLEIMDGIAKKHPNVELMACSSGGGRTDFGTLHYFHEFWPSDNTDALRRATMQWDYLTFYPAITLASHVTEAGHRPMKFNLDVALSVRFGMDLDLTKLNAEEKEFIAGAVDVYKKRLRQVVQFGDVYRLDNPHTGPRAALVYVSPDRAQAAVFVHQLRDGDTTPTKLAGLSPEKRYKVRELNLAPGATSTLPQNGQVIEGNVLMKDGLTTPCGKAFESVVVELVEEK